MSTPVGGRLLLSQLRMGGFETAGGLPKPAPLLPLGLFVVSDSGAVTRLSGDCCGRVGRVGAGLLLRVGVNPLRASFVGRRRWRGVRLRLGAMTASTGMGTGESKSSGARLLRLLEDKGVDGALGGVTREVTASTVRACSIRPTEWAAV